MGNSKEKIPLQRVDANRWRIPQEYNTAMHVPGMVYADDELIALVCDGRSGIDAGLTLAELAELMADLGARQAINLDGGGSTALIHHGHLLNQPYDAQDQPSNNSRAVATAAIFHAAATPSSLNGAAA